MHEITVYGVPILIGWEWLILIIGTPLHEFGHYITYRIMGFKPKIKWEWYGPTIGGNIVHTVPLKKHYWAGLMGPLFGLPVAMFFSWFWIGLYLFTCIIDFGHLGAVTALYLKGWDMDMTVGEAVKRLKEEGKHGKLRWKSFTG